MKEHEDKDLIKEVLTVSEVQMIVQGYFNMIENMMKNPRIPKVTSHTHLENEILSTHVFLDSVKELLFNAEEYAQILYELEEENGE